MEGLRLIIYLLCLAGATVDADSDEFTVYVLEGSKPEAVSQMRTGSQVEENSLSRRNQWLESNMNFFFSISGFRYFSLSEYPLLVKEHHFTAHSLLRQLGPSLEGGQGAGGLAHKPTCEAFRRRKKGQKGRKTKEAKRAANTDKDGTFFKNMISF